MAPRVVGHPGTWPTSTKGDTVDNRSLAQPTRSVFANQRLLKEITELTGIEYRVLSSAFACEEKNLALDVVKTAVGEGGEERI